MSDFTKDVEKVLEKADQIGEQDNSLVLKLKNGFEAFQTDVVDLINNWEKCCVTSGKAKVVFQKIGVYERALEQAIKIKNNVKNNTGTYIEVGFLESVKVLELLRYSRNFVNNLTNEINKVERRFGEFIYAEYILGKMNSIAESIEEVFKDICLQMASIGTMNTSRTIKGKISDSYTHTHRDKVVKALKDFPELQQQVKEIAAKAEEEAFIALEKRRQEERLRKERERQERIAQYTALFPVCLTPYTGGTVDTEFSVWHYQPNEQNAEFPPSIETNGVRFTWYGNESTGKVVMVGQEECGWTIWDGNDLDYHSNYGICWSYISDDHVTWIRQLRNCDAPDTIILGEESITSTGNLHPNLIRNCKVSGSVPFGVLISIFLFKYSTNLIAKQKKEYEYRKAYNSAKERLLERALKRVQSAALKSCRFCNTSGANIRVCMDCLHSYCSNCKSGSINVCPRCNGYNGSSVPSFASSLPFSMDPSEQEIINEMR
eukprot:TRINITY_DN2629_c0_g3_i3.p1 TRINITY_DN2629_c0_g3~~TRINITY_DN2629_c0_g3_i3.p1  ORF type:complete len:562 (-),score=126.74 TRINITY_DN2629_c0_g3_i3:902-2368(-)